MDIRLATSLDRNDIRQVHLSAFPVSEGETVAKLAVNLLSEESAPRAISLLAEISGQVIGHIAFSPVTLNDNEQMQSYILAPLGVKPGFQNQRVGTKLIDHGIELLSNMAVNLLFVYGDPDYYNRFGFRVDLAAKFIPPYRLQYPFGWQALILNEMDSVESPVKISCVGSLCDPDLW